MDRFPNNLKEAEIGLWREIVIQLVILQQNAVNAAALNCDNPDLIYQLQDQLAEAWKTVVTIAGRKGIDHGAFAKNQS